MKKLDTRLDKQTKKPWINPIVSLVILVAFHSEGRALSDTVITHDIRLNFLHGNHPSLISQKQSSDSEASKARYMPFNNSLDTKLIFLPSKNVQWDLPSGLTKLHVHRAVDSPAKVSNNLESGSPQSQIYYFRPGGFETEYLSYLLLLCILFLLVTCWLLNRRLQRALNESKQLENKHPSNSTANQPSLPNQLLHVEFDDQGWLKQSILEDSSAIIYAKDLDGNYILVNKGFEELSGLSRVEALGKNDSEIYGPNFASKLQENDRIVVAEKKSQRIYESIDNVNYFLSLKFPLFNSGGEVAGVGGISTIINEQKQLEEQLAYEGNVLNSALEGSNLGLAIYDITNDNFEFSEILESQLGYRNKELENRFGLSLNKYLQIVHPEEREYFCLKFENIIKGKIDSYEMELRLKTAAGDWKWIMNSAQRVALGEGGETNRIVGIQQDISARKSLEDDMRRDQARLSMALKGGNLGFWEYLVPTNDFLVSNLYREILGYDDTEGAEVSKMESSLWSMSLHPDDRKKVYEDFSACLIDESEEHHIEYRIKAADGSWKWLLSIGRKFSHEDLDHSAELIGVMIDITSLKSMEEGLRLAKENAEQAVHAKTNFLAMMSHEIRTPMNAIVGMVDLLRQSNMTGDQNKMLHTISESGQSLLTIINDILDFSKIEEGRVELEVVPFLLSDTIEGAVRTLSVPARNKGLRLFTFVDPSLPQFVRGDQVRVRQIVLNLVGNAVKFSEDGAIQVNVHKMSEEDDQLTLRIEVIDQGIGISRQAQDRLFEAFTQAETETTRKYGGTGLGLTICKRLTKLMKGSIFVNSELGSGSTFSVELPFKKVDKHVDEKVRDLSGVDILTCIENKDERRIVRDYLTHFNAKVESIESFETCIENCLNSSRPGNKAVVVVVGPGTPSKDIIKAKKTIAHKSKSIIQWIALVRGGQDNKKLISKQITPVDTDPTSRSAIASAVAICAGKASPDVNYGVDDFLDLPQSQSHSLQSVEDAIRENRLILVAEDNETNRDVIRRQLEHLGYASEIFEDGIQALAAWKKRKYGLLLTDCHMPNMDGFELTNQIRNLEKRMNNGGRFPIVAVTANAMRGEADRCLAAGMDSYLSKPVDLRDLKKTLNRWFPKTTDKAPLNSMKSTISNGSGKNRPELSKLTKEQEGVLDLSILRGLVGEDDEVVKEILNGFVEPSTLLLEEIKLAHTGRIAESLGNSAHKLKSAAKSIGALDLGDLCQVLESAAKVNDLETIDREVGKIDGLMEDVMESIHQIT